MRILRGDRLGLVGANGAGKTTLINLLTGGLAPDAGEVKRGASLAMATLDQNRASLDPQTSAERRADRRRQRLCRGRRRRANMSSAICRIFSSARSRRGTPIGRLSGGERGRLMLARALAQPTNLLVLDEPTNDLDLETLDLLQEMLADYKGTVILVEP